MWLVLSMITDVSVNSHPDGEDNDNEHTNGDGTTSQLLGWIALETPELWLPTIM